MDQQEITLTQYIEQTQIMYKNTELVGEKLARKYHILTEEAKRLIRTLLKELYYFHKEGKCPEHFKKSNVFVTRFGEAKLRDVSFGGKDNSTVLQNYKDACTIIKETVFQQYKKDIPEDMMHLLRLMGSPATVIDMEYVICTHASLVPLENRKTFFMRMYDHINSVLSHDKPSVQRHILQALPYGIEWYNKLKGNRLLEELFEWKKDESKKGTKVFLKSYRNATVHEMDDYCRREKYTSDDFQLILSVTFPNLLPRMQEELEKVKQLRDLKFDSLFGSNLPT